MFLSFSAFQRQDLREHNRVDSPQLYEDLTRLILTFADTRSAVRFSQVDKASHRLIFSSKEIWTAIASRLITQRFIDLAPGRSLSELDLDEILALVKRVALGPEELRKHSNPENTLATQVVSFVPPSDYRAVGSSPRAVLIPEGSLFVTDSSWESPRIDWWQISRADEQVPVRHLTLGDGLDGWKVANFIVGAAYQGRFDLLVCLKRIPIDMQQNDHPTTKTCLWRYDTQTAKYELEETLLLAQGRPDKIFLALGNDLAIVYGEEDLVLYWPSARHTLRISCKTIVTSATNSNNIQRPEDICLVDEFLIFRRLRRRTSVHRIAVWDLRALQKLYFCNKPVGWSVEVNLDGVKGYMFEVSDFEPGRCSYLVGSDYMRCFSDPYDDNQILIYMFFIVTKDFSTTYTVRKFVLTHAAPIGSYHPMRVRAAWHESGVSASASFPFFAIYHGSRGTREISWARRKQVDNRLVSRLYINSLSRTFVFMEPGRLSLVYYA